MTDEPRWCADHGRVECTKQRKRGGDCHGSAVRGTDRCRMHLGKAVAVVRREVLTAWAAEPGDDGISPADAVAGQLGLAWRRAALLGEALRRQVEGAADGSGAADADGLVGHRYGASKAAGGVYAVGEQVRALAELERHERELVGRFAELAHRMGIEDTRVAVTAELVAWVTAVMDRALSAAPLSAEQIAAVHAELAAAAVAIPEPRAINGGRWV